MKIYQKCPVCNTEHESRHEWASLEDFYEYDGSMGPEFEHDEGNRDCGGSVTYSEG